MKLLLVVLACIGIALAYVAVVLATPAESEFCTCTSPCRGITSTCMWSPDGHNPNISRCLGCGKVVRP